MKCPDPRRGKKSKIYFVDLIRAFLGLLVFTMQKFQKFI